MKAALSLHQTPRLSSPPVRHARLQSPPYRFDFRILSLDPKQPLFPVLRQVVLETVPEPEQPVLLFCFSRGGLKDQLIIRISVYCMPG